MDLLTTCTHHSELQVITALLLISTFQKSPQYPLSLFLAFCVFTSYTLATASNSGDSSASRLQVLFPQLPVEELLSTVNSIIVPSLLSLPCRTQMNCQPSTELVAPILFFITTLHGPHRKHRSSIFACVFVSARTCLPSCRCLFAYCIVTGALVVCFEVFA
jgi:hypothetical protein